MNSYDLNGNKQSFANWISMLRNYETPFLNLVKTDKVNHTLFSWQTDRLAAPNGNNYSVEGSDAVTGNLAPTKVVQNVTQILSKVVKVSDTAAKVESWGRKQETAYQMEKAGLELFKDLEWAFLNNVAYEAGGNDKPRITAGVRGLAQPINLPCQSTGAVTHLVTDKDITEDDLFDLTYNLYLAGSKANMICYHPSMALFFTKLMESDTKARIFKNNPQLMLEVFTIVDPLGQRYLLMPLRQMPKDVIYVINKEDFTQKVLRAPSRTLLDREGSYDKWLLEMEIGLRLSNPCAAGILQKVNTSNKLLKKQRLHNLVTTSQTLPTTEAQVAVDFVTSTGFWYSPITNHDVTVANTSPALNIFITSADVRPDKMQLKVYDITTQSDPEHTVINQFLPSDGKPQKASFTSGILQANKKYRIEVYGYVDGQYVKQVLGKITLKTSTP